MPLKLDDRYLKGFVSQHEYEGIGAQVKCASELLMSGKGQGSDFLGWVTLPEDYDKEEFARIKSAAERIKKNSQVFIVIGIGGSYLGARAAIEFLKSDKYNDLPKDTPDIYFAGRRAPAGKLLPAAGPASKLRFFSYSYTPCRYVIGWYKYMPEHPHIMQEVPRQAKPPGDFLFLLKYSYYCTLPYS